MEKSWKFLTKTLGLKTKTLLFVLEAPRDQDYTAIRSGKWSFHDLQSQGIKL